MKEVVYFGAGCFWGVQENFNKLPVVHSTEVGYAGGTTEKPSYEEVCRADTGHVEVVKVEFSQGSLNELLHFFFKIHDPTQGNAQGPDRGTQYRSVVFTTTDEQLKQANLFVEQLEASKTFSNPITTTVEAFRNYTKAEEYHQNYAQKKGWSCV